MKRKVRDETPAEEISMEPEESLAGEQGEQTQKDAKNKAYRDLVKTESVKTVNVPDKKEEDKGAITISEAMENSDDLTDMQFAIKQLFPKKLDGNSVMVARVGPDVFLPMLHLKSVNEIMKADPTKAIDVSGLYANNYVRLSIGLDGQGRIDIAEITGATREAKKTERLSGSADI